MFRSITPTLMYITAPFNAVLYHEWNKNKNNDVFTLALRPSSKVTFTCNNGWIMNIQEPTFNSTSHDVLRLLIPVQFYEHVWFSLEYLQVLNKFLIYKFYFVNFAIDFFFFIDFAHSHTCLRLYLRQTLWLHATRFHFYNYIASNTVLSRSSNIIYDG